MIIFELVFKLALFLAIASVIIPFALSIIGMLLPFIGAAIVILIVVALIAK